MSMILRRAHTLSTSCPWCKSQNEFDLNSNNITWYVLLIGYNDLTDRRGDSQTCSGKYSRIEEVHDVITQNPRRRYKKLQKELRTAGPSPPKKPRVKDDDDIHSYIRVQIHAIKFLLNQAAPRNIGSPTQKVVVRRQDLKDSDVLAQLLAEHSHLSEDDCQAAISDQLQLPSRLDSHKSRQFGANIDPFELLHSMSLWSSPRPRPRPQSRPLTCHYCGQIFPRVDQTFCEICWRRI